MQIVTSESWIILFSLQMFGFHWCVWLFGSRQIRDTQCGFKLLSRDAAKMTFPSLHIERWAFDVELVCLQIIKLFPQNNSFTHEKKNLFCEHIMQLWRYKVGKLTKLNVKMYFQLIFLENVLILFRNFHFTIPLKRHCLLCQHELMYA